VGGQGAHAAQSLVVRMGARWRMKDFSLCAAAAMLVVSPCMKHTMPVTLRSRAPLAVDAAALPAHSTPALPVLC
jgi:hypothetical protein